MGISLLTPELAKWDLLGETDEERPELLALPFFADERPLRGAAGLADWRLCGRLSRMLLAGRVDGGFGEATLLPANGLPFRTLVLYGLGDTERFTELRYLEAAKAIRDLARHLGVNRYALPLPGRSTGRIMARRALELWVQAQTSEEQVWLVEPPAAQKEMSEVLGRSRR
jgi:hypothetical protein